MTNQNDISARNERIEASSLDIREELCNLIDHAPAGGVWHTAETQPLMRNSFNLRLDPAGPIFTVTVTYGGAMSTPSEVAT